MTGGASQFVQNGGAFGALGGTAHTRGIIAPAEYEKKSGDSDENKAKAVANGMRVRLRKASFALMRFRLE
jgi:hypothetical protein